VHETVPTVFLIARPSIDVEGMRSYLEDVGGESWLELRLGEVESGLGVGNSIMANYCSSSADAPATSSLEPA